jgi:predicted amino acid racemase
VVLMVELGDLREGVLPDDLVGLARHARDLPGLVLRGIGTNLACRSGVVPDADNMARLSALAADVEDELGVHLSTVSGGNSANLRWALGGGDLGRVDDLRLGEAILLGVDPLDRQPIAGLHQDAFSLVAEVIESKRKPTVAWGQRAQTAFAEHPAERAPGTVAQSILAVGRQDVDPLDLEPPPGATIAASSSDHLVVETEELLAPGTELAFRPGYAALLRAATSPFVHVVGAGRSARPPA